MAEKIRIKTVEMVRHIRDEQTQMLAGKSKAEIIAFFRNSGETARQGAKQRHSDEQQPQRTG
jgi:hypothetical protein